MKIAAIITSCKRFCAVKQATIVSIAAFVHIAKEGNEFKAAFPFSELANAASLASAGLKQSSSTAFA